VQFERRTEASTRATLCASSDPTGNSATTLACEFQRTEWRRHDSEHETTTGDGKEAKTIKQPKKNGVGGWMPRKHFWLPPQGEVFFA
jgi:hypothetical protein